MSDLQLSDLQFAVVGKDGVYSKPMPIDCGEIRVDPVDDSFYVTRIRNEFSGTFSTTLVSVDYNAIQDLLGDAQQSTYDIAFERSVTKGLYRYDKVWRYRMERKGNKSNRKRCRRRKKNLVSTKTRTVLRNATVRVDDRLSDSVLPMYDVTFKANVR